MEEKDLNKLIDQKLIQLHDVNPDDEEGLLLYKKHFSDLSLKVTHILKHLVQNNLPYKDSKVYRISMLLDKQLTKEIIDPIGNLIEYHINSNHPDKLMSLMTCFKCIDLENENKRLTLTDKQYQTWLETDITHINTEQFEILYGIPKRKQQELRSYRKDHLPSFQIDGKGKHYYNKKEVEQWLSNYKRVSPFN